MQILASGGIRSAGLAVPISQLVARPASGSGECPRLAGKGGSPERRCHMRVTSWVAFLGYVEHVRLQNAASILIFLYLTTPQPPNNHEVSKQDQTLTAYP